MARREVRVSAPLDPGQLRAVKDGELRGYESTSLAVNSTNPDPASAAATPPPPPTLHPIPGTAGLGVRSQGARRHPRARTGSRDSPSDYNSGWSQTGLWGEGGGGKQHVTSLSVPWLFWCLCLFQSCVRAGAEHFVNSQKSLLIANESNGCRWTQGMNTFISLVSRKWCVSSPQEFVWCTWTRSFPEGDWNDEANPKLKISMLQSYSMPL